MGRFEYKTVKAPLEKMFLLCQRLLRWSHRQTIDWSENHLTHTLFAAPIGCRGMIVGMRTMTGRVKHGGIYRSSALRHPPCDGTTSASVWPSSRYTRAPSYPYTSDRTPPVAVTMKHAVGPCARSSPLPRILTRRQDLMGGILAGRCRGSRPYSDISIFWYLF